MPTVCVSGDAQREVVKMTTNNRIGVRWRRRRIGGAVLALALLSGCGPKHVAPPQPLAPAGPYRIGPGDVLDVIVWREDNVTSQVNVRPDGMISVPLVGDVAAGGKTPEELAADIKVAAGFALEALSGAGVWAGGGGVGLGCGFRSAAGGTVAVASSGTGGGGSG